jgi:hypothetical protein
MKKYAVLFPALFLWMSVCVFACGKAFVPGSDSETIRGGEVHPSVMLVLGSKDPMVRKTRVALARDLLQRQDLHFDKVVLSGGCGAHGTDMTNCEASDMEQLLKEACGDDIADISVYKEESSGSTVQNYCNSRNLEDDGEKVIRKGDSLYVVSSHYHALSVAACFKNDGVDAHYYYICGGSLYEGVAPSLEEMAAANDPCFQDYTGIADNCGNADWCDWR